ncbi:MAG: hypothetical protein A2X82_18265 [Geobacteraceae bacterium GWC2_55_20]|nr:MAG: hypothetical protein A2X82_18265 [Geobacteraceae bacterium GWC2_55_20]OGU26351.1 MAG: hypothetical protein A2X85_15885 [Geobacteraceae bacterium GWF2_54_21]HBA70811.1 hypothetical protein [Geobacter sp.]HCE68119.1 hypothetical protein [Geobacter sp.]
MKLFSFIINIAIIVACITGCSQELFFSITDASNPAYPKFCITSKKDCRGQNLILAMADISEVDESGNAIKKMWAIQARTNATQKEYVYGNLPDGWIEITPARPLELGKTYTFNGGAFYFRIISVGATYKAEVLTLEEYVKRKHTKLPIWQNKDNQ